MWLIMSRLNVDRKKHHQIFIPRRTRNYGHGVRADEKIGIPWWGIPEKTNEKTTAEDVFANSLLEQLRR